ncbi:MAG: PAS domain S-box protein [Sporomusaceae bacterium]|nr:PAS domain S-box protein [Sporomusaceae bacterium]
MTQEQSSETLLRLDELRRQELYFRLLTELLEQVIWRIDLETMTVIDVSPSVKKLRGYAPAELIGRPLREMVTAGCYQRIQEKMTGWLEQLPYTKTSAIQFLEIVEQPHRDGTNVWTEVAVGFFRRADGGMEELGISRQLGQQKGLVDVCRQLAESERFLQVIWDAAPCMLSCVDCEGRFLLINDRFADKSGLAQTDAPGRHFSEVLPHDPEIQAKHARIFAACLAGETVEFLDQYRVEGEDCDRWLYGKYQPVLSGEGSVSKVIAAIMDVTGQQEMKRQLNEAEKIGRMGSWYLHLPTGKFTCSDGLLALYGISREDFASTGRELFWSRLDDAAQQRLRRWEDLDWLIKQKELTAEVRLHLPDGKSHLVRINGNMRTGRDERPAEIYGTVTDVTERRALEDAERRALLRLREFLRTMPGAGMIVDSTGLVMEVFDDNGLLGENAAANWTGRNLNCLLPPEAAQRLAGIIRYAIENSRLQLGECLLDISRGRRSFAVRIAPLSRSEGEPPAAACYWTDTTDQQRVRELLELTYEKRRQSELLNDLIDGSLQPTPEVLDQAWQVKLNLTQDFSCYLLTAAAWEGVNCEWRQRKSMQEAMELLMAELEPDGIIIWESRDGIVLLEPVSSDHQPTAASEIAQANRWLELASAHVPQAQLGIGIAEFRPHTFKQLAPLYDQARTAAKLGRKLAPCRRVHHYLDIGVFQFFSALADKEQLHQFTQRTLGKLIEYDRLQGTDLLDTLEKILHADKLATVAKDMYIHRQTVLFRKQRIEQVLGISLDEFEVRLALGMALKFKKAFIDES